MTGTAGSIHLQPSSVFTVMPQGELSLLPTPNTWTDLPGTDLLLPQAGLYDLDVTWRAHLQGIPPGHYHVTGRLWDVDAGVVVPGSETWVAQFNILGADVESGEDNTADAHVPYRVTAATTIRMQATYVPIVGTATTARILSTPTGWTRVRATAVARS